MSILTILGHFGHFDHWSRANRMDYTNPFMFIFSGEYAGLRAIMSYLTSKVTNLKFQGIQNHMHHTFITFFRAKETVTSA